MELVYYLPHRLYSLPQITSRVDPVQVSFSQMFNPSISLVDRTGTIACPPVPVRIVDPFPQWTTTQNFDEICHARYNALIDHAIKTDRKLVIFYSGGIDSTLIAALAISHPGWQRHKHMVYLAFSQDSVIENPSFWISLRKEFGDRLLNSTSYHNLICNDGNLCITGEFADNIFGSLTLKSYMDQSGDVQAIHKPFRSTGMEWMIGKIQQKEHRERCAQMLIDVLATSPRSLDTNHDCFWWLNFVLKWQAVKYRLASHAPDARMAAMMASRIVHFFETREFQNWAVTTNESKVLNDWFSYKLPAKKMIYEINKDRDYFVYKTKYPSIPSLTRYGNTWSYVYQDVEGKYTATQQFLA